MGDLLHSSDTELRITAGEAIALLYDMSRCIDEVRKLHVYVNKVSIYNLKTQPFAMLCGKMDIF